MAGPATSAAPAFSLSRLPPAARFGVGGVFVVLIALVYWVVFFTDISSKIELKTECAAMRTSRFRWVNKLPARLHGRQRLTSPDLHHR